MILYDEKGEKQICHKGHESSWEVLYGGEKDDTGTPIEYQCLVCGETIEGDFWAE